MYIKINAFLCSFLILFASAVNLFAFDRHSCEREQQQDNSHCPMPMEKMDCCPMEQEENSCNCPEMNNDSSDPEETAPYVIFNAANHPGEFIFGKFILLAPDLAIQKEYSFSENLSSNLTHNKIYKTIHSFLI